MLVESQQRFQPRGARRMTLAVLFDNIGPYHAARLSALAPRCDLQAIELRGRSAEYDWLSPAEVGFERTTLAGPGDDASNVRRLLDAALARRAPDAVFIPGWSSRFSLSALLWARRSGTPAFVMSDTQEIDFARSAHKEWIKRRILANFSGALVAGTPHRDYVEGLGMAGAAVRTGYDVVDNGHFAQGAREARAGAEASRRRYGLPARYFLAIARFIEKKNLPFLLDAYIAYRRAMERQHPGVAPWDLVLAGDGPLRGALTKQLDDAGFGHAVHMPGFVQYAELPSYYALAGAFIHASSTDQWGLVVNEAMASGLPVLVSDRCGCAPDLVAGGGNGFTFSPSDEAGLVRLMLRMTLMDDRERQDMGAASQRRIALLSPETFAEGVLELAFRPGGDPGPLRVADGLLLHALIAARKHG